MIVVDASVAVKWFLPEPGEKAAHKWLTGRHRLTAPAIIQIEVAGAILRCFREGRISETRARECCQAWEHVVQNGIVELVPNAELFKAAVDFAFRCRHTVQDCLYLAAGEKLDAGIVTADRTLVERAQGVVKDVRLLGAEKVG